MGYVYLGQSRIASIFKEVLPETLIDKLCNKSAIEILDIPEGVTTIGDYLFYNCPNLTKVIIPASVNYIGTGAFYNSSNSIEVIEFNGPPPREVGENAFPATSGTYLDEYIEQWVDVLPYDGEWHNLTFTNPISENYTVVTYLNGSTASFLIEGEISGRSGSPYYTTQIDNVRDAKEIRIGTKVTSIGENAFYSCSRLTSVTIPPSVTSIGNYAFYNCRSLTSITIPSSVTTIGNSAFRDCTSLTSVTIPSSVTTLWASTFYNCSSLTSFVVDSANQHYSAINGLLCSKDGKTLVACPGGLTSMTIPEGVETIGVGACYNYSNLTSITIPSTVTYISDGVFIDCLNLTSITFNGNPPTAYEPSFPSANTNLIGYYLPENAAAWTAVITNGKWHGMTMEEYINLDYTYVTYSDGSTSSFLIEGKIAGRSSSPYYTKQIDNVQNAKEIKIGKAVTSIGNNSFYNCLNLTSITIPEGVTEIGGYVFYNCYRLTSITIPPTVTSIGDAALYQCGSLTSVTIPSSVTSIGAIAFIWCSALVSITFEGKTQSQVKAMSKYDWSLPAGKIIKCTDGQFTTT